MRSAQVAVATAFVLATAALAVVFPLATYTLTLATLGLPHVVAELRYVDARFAPRAGRGLVRLVLVLLGVVVLLRAAGLLGLAPAGRLGLLELGVVGALAASALPALARPALEGRAGRRGLAALAPVVVGVVVVLALGAGALAGSAATLVTLAFLHNLTPVGLLAERLRGRARARALAACALAFVAAPALLASGLLHGALASSLQVDATPLASAGGLERSLGSFVPAPLVDGAWALPLFSAAAFLQVMHYAVVLGVLPRLDDGASWSRPRALAPWPRPRAMLVVTALAGLLLLPLFVRDFALARRVYGLAAAVHAWLEVPALLLAFVPDPRPLFLGAEGAQVAEGAEGAEGADAAAAAAAAATVRSEPGRSPVGVGG